MKKLLLILAVVAVAAPAAFAAERERPEPCGRLQGGAEGDGRGRLQVPLRADGSTAASAIGKCVSKHQSSAATNRVERGQGLQGRAGDVEADFRAAHGGKSFAETYGANDNDKNAYGKCVSKKAERRRAQQETAVAEGVEGVQDRARHDDRVAHRVQHQVRRQGETPSASASPRRARPSSPPGTSCAAQRGGRGGPPLSTSEHAAARDTCAVEANSARSVARRRGAVSRDTLRAVVAALRPKQYTKNLLLFAALLFADQAGSLDAWAAATTAFVAYCLASSASYLVNDVRDAPEDRKHPVKRLRPIARGDLPPRAALGLSALLVAASLALAAALGAGSLAYLVTFLVVQALYSSVLKAIVLVDVAAIATLFVLRAGAGAEAIDVPISGWLLVSTALLASFLALAKRRAELAVVRSGRTPGRTSIRRYTVSGLDQLLAALAAVTVVVYTAYAALAHTPLLLVTVPLVVFGLARYLGIVRHDGHGEEPENVLLTDGPLVATVAAWAVLAGVIVALS